MKFPICTIIPTIYEIPCLNSFILYHDFNNWFLLRSYVSLETPFQGVSSLFSVT